MYKKRCKEADIPEHHWAIPRKVVKETQAKTEKQGNLDGIVTKFQGSQVFTHEGLCHAVTQFISCDDQVSLAYLSTSIVLKVVLPSCWAVASRCKQGCVPELLGYYETKDTDDRPANDTQCHGPPPQQVCCLDWAVEG
jgi:hypothetical protein